VDPPKILASRAVSLFRHTTARAALLGSALAYGQEMEPRTFSAVPVGTTNFVALGYGRSSGGFSA
jgi:ABC-type Mn2+/Zn2+ transport system permease subunit